MARRPDIEPKRPALITGGCGFVGRHVAATMLSRGHDIWIVDDLSTGQNPDRWLKGIAASATDGAASRHYRVGARRITFVHADVRDFLRAHMSAPAPGLTSPSDEQPRFGDVVHLASIVGGRAKIDGEPLALAADLAIDAEFFQWAIRVRPHRILYASSSAAYPIDLQGEAGATRLREDMIDFDGRLGVPDMVYGWSKLTGEYLARLAATRYGLHVACVRPFSGYGEDQDDSYPVPAIARRAAAREDPLVVWGSGKQGRDFVHIDDCVEAMCLALDQISDGSAVNIGSGALTTFMEVARMFARLARYTPKIQSLDDKPTGVHTRFADITQARDRLGWKPRISLEVGFQRVLDAVSELVRP